MLNLSQPANLAFFNLFLFIIVIISLTFYHFIYPRKKLPFLLTLIIISCLPIWSFWRQGVPESGDFDLHTKFLMSFYNSLEKGIFLPQWSAEFCEGFGWPLFKYFYRTHLYIASLFHFLGFSFINSLKLLFSLVFVFAGTNMFLWLKSEFEEKYAFIGSLFYLFAPYHLIDLHFKHTIGENLGFMLTPLIFLMVNKVIKEKKLKWLFLLILTYSLLILSHHIVPILMTPIILIYALIKISLDKNLKTKYQKIIKIQLLLIGFVSAILLTAFHWLPIISEKSFIQQSEVSLITFHPLDDFLFSKWKYGFLFQGQFGENGSLIGYTQLLMIVIGLILFFKKKLTKNNHFLLGFFIFTFFLSLLMMQSLTSPLWQVIPLLNTFYFSTRFLFVVTFISAPITALVAKNYSFHSNFFLFKNINKEKQKNFSLILISLLTIGYTILNWGNRGMINDITDEDAYAQIYGRCDKPTTPIWFSYDDFSLFSNRRGNLEILSGEATFIELERNSQLHQYEIEAQSNILLKENTAYFPGWVIRDNNKEIEIDYQNKKYPGLMVFELDKGPHFLRLEFMETKIEKKSKQISITTFLFLSLIGLYLFVRKKLTKSK